MFEVGSKIFDVGYIFRDYQTILFQPFLVPDGLKTISKRLKTRCRRCKI
jgi:hypothetical protein